MEIPDLAHRLVPACCRRHRLGARHRTPCRGERRMSNPRPLGERERTLIELYANCQLELAPEAFTPSGM
jgi:hypothetical protein